MKKHNYKVGDKVRITGNDGKGIHHFYKDSEICIVEGVIDEARVKVYSLTDDIHQIVSTENVELVETDMPAIFNRDDIKAGYLLEVKRNKQGVIFYMTVVPTKYGDPDEHLGCANPGKDWWPLCRFDKDTLTYRDCTIMRIYGPTSNRLLLDNTAEDRELLWVRQEGPKVVEMTLAEISEKLGYEVKIVQEKEKGTT